MKQLDKSCKLCRVVQVFGQPFLYDIRNPIVMVLKGAVCMSNWEERSRRLDIFEDTLRRCEREFSLIQKIAYVREHTEVWERPLEEIFLGVSRYESSCDVKIMKSNVLREVRTLKEIFPSCRVAVLNCAAPRHSGGSVIRGGDGWEESLCRCTTLYPCMNTDYLRQVYYEENCLCENEFYRDVCVYIPDVVCLKNEEGELWKQGERFVVDVISCSMPDICEQLAERNGKSNVEADRQRVQECEEIICRRIEGMIKVGIQQNIDVLVLGVEEKDFLGIPLEVVTEIIKKALQKYTYFLRAMHVVL